MTKLNIVAYQPEKSLNFESSAINVTLTISKMVRGINCLQTGFVWTYVDLFIWRGFDKETSIITTWDTLLFFPHHSQLIDSLKQVIPVNACLHLYAFLNCQEVHTYMHVHNTYINLFRFWFWSLYLFTIACPFVVDVYLAAVGYRLTNREVIVVKCIVSIWTNTTNNTHIF